MTRKLDSIGSQSKEFIESVFETILNREPTESDIHFYQMRLNHEKWKSQIFCEVATSTEALKSRKTYRLDRQLKKIITIYRIVRYLPLGKFRWRFMPSFSAAHEKNLIKPRSTQSYNENNTNKQTQDIIVYTYDIDLLEKDTVSNTSLHSGVTMQNELVDKINSSALSESTSNKDADNSFPNIESYLRYIQNADQSVCLPSHYNWDYLNNEMFIRFLYRWLLHRTPDYEALINYVEHLSNGVPRETILNEIHSSSECSILANKLRADPANITISPFTLEMEDLVKAIVNKNNEV